MLKKLNDQNFDTEISNGTVLVDFYAEWCGPCKMIAPILDEIAEEREDIVVGKVNVDESVAIASKYQIVSIPTLIVFKDGKEQKRSVGYMPKSAVISIL